MSRLEDCDCRYPCDCGSPAEVAISVLAEHLRSEHLAAHDVPNALPWRQLQSSEKGHWILKARAFVARRVAEDEAAGRHTHTTEETR
jgi:hypothetical protein